MKDNFADEMPLLAAMKKYMADGAVAYHTPGHKQGKGIPEAMRALITDAGLKMEVSLMEELDDLHAPSGCLLAAEKRAAELYGADESFFVINGTTAAIQAMIMAAAGDGDKIIMPRNVHRSVMGGLVLSGALPVYVRPEIDAKLGIAMHPAKEKIAAAIRENPDAKAVLIVYPTYYGVAAELAAIADMAHEAGMLLLVDEAHGPHLKFSSKLPPQALDCGADAVAQSTHKIVGALTQCSMLHIKGARIDRERVRTFLSLLQSTSPNYLLLASLDAAVWQMRTDGRALVARAVELARQARIAINAIEGLYAFGAEHLGENIRLDETKITVNVSGLGMNGAAAEYILRHEHKIQAELSDENNILFIISYADTKKEVEHLVNALKCLAEKSAVHKKVQAAGGAGYALLPKAVLSPRKALKMRKRRCLFTESLGEIAAETITFYPPGIPLVCSGEEISRELIDACKKMQREGLKVTGAEDLSLEYINVIEK
jgi:lysine decarboxylase